MRLLLLLLLSMELDHDRRTHLLKILLFFSVFFLILQGIPFAQSHHLLSLSFTVSRSAVFSLLSTFGSSAACFTLYTQLSKLSREAIFSQPLCDRSMSAFDSLPVSLVMVMALVLPVLWHTHLRFHSHLYRGKLQSW